MGSEGGYPNDTIGGGFTTDLNYPITALGGLFGAPSQDRPEPYPLPSLERLERLRPPRWLVDAIWWTAAKSTDVIETFGLRVGATYDEHLEPILRQWQDPDATRRDLKDGR